MPYRDPEKKIEAMKRWRQDAIAKGYGRWLYARRKLRFDDAGRFRTAIEGTLDVLQRPSKKQSDQINKAIEVLSSALAESLEAEDALGRFGHLEERE